jgi:hypothetical protein
MWWMPSWLERRLPHLHIEAEEAPAEVPPGEADREREEIPT